MKSGCDLSAAHEPVIIKLDLSQIVRHDSLITKVLKPQLVRVHCTYRHVDIYTDSVASRMVKSICGKIRMTQLRQVSTY